MLASCIALAGYLVLREYLPYRNPTDNTTALLAQGVVFLWCFFLVLRDAGVFDGWPPAILGTLLTLVTVTVWCHALRCAYVEAFANETCADDASNETQAETIVSQGGDPTQPEHGRVVEMELTTMSASSKQGGESPGNKSERASPSTTPNSGGWGSWLESASLCVTPADKPQTPPRDDEDDDDDDPPPATATNSC